MRRLSPPRRVTLCVLLLTLGVTASTAARGDEVGREYDGGVIVAYRRLAVDSEGETVETIEDGDPIVLLKDGTEFVIDSRHLEDPDGNRYYIVGDAWQESEDTPVVYETRYVQYTTKVMTEEEIEAQYVAIKEEAGTFETGDLERFRERRRTGGTVPERTRPLVQPLLQDRLDAAADDDTIEVMVTLTAQPSELLPRPHHEIADSEPALYLDLVEERVLAIEGRKSETRSSQADLVATVEDAGGRVDDQHWFVNSFSGEIPAGVIKRLAEDSRIATLDLRGVLEVSDNQMEDIRKAAQIEDPTEWDTGGACSPCADFLKNTGYTYDGSRASGLSDAEGILVGVLDTRIDIDHPVLEDRLYGAWVRSDPPTETWDVDTTGMGLNYDDHGITVSSLLLGDLEDGQDTSVGSVDWERGSGVSPGSYLVALPVTGSGAGSGSLETAIEFLLELPATAGIPDIINASVGYNVSTDGICDPDHYSNDWIDLAMKHDIFVVVASGNENGNYAACNVTMPATASGAFTVGSISIEAANLQNAPVRTYSSRGPDLHGRSVVDIVAPDGREPGGSPGYVSYDACYDDTYCDKTYDGGWGTSFAAPLVAGAAANYKDFLIHRFGTAMANDVGNIYVQMLLMSDLPTTARALDPKWGVGRLRMRLWDYNGEAMDTPWRMRYGVGTLEDGELSVLTLNPDAGGVNQTLPNAVDHFRASLWWHEPDLGSIDTPAEITFGAYDGTHTFSDLLSQPGAQRTYFERTAGAYTYPLGASGGVWELRINGLNVTASNELDYYPSEQKRTIYVAVYWEDLSRDDANGPNSSIQ